jgi:hypothetical protein
MRHEILSVGKAKAKLLDLTRKIQEDGRAYILTDKKTMRDLTVALADERHGRLFKRDRNGR